MHHFMMLQESGFAWDESQKGKFREDFFPPGDHPCHRTYSLGTQKYSYSSKAYTHEVIEIVKDKIASGIYEPSSSSSSFQMVHSLQERRTFTSDHTRLTAAQRCYHLQLRGASAHRTASESLWHVRLLRHIQPLCSLRSRLLSVKSRDLTTFQTPLGTFCLSMLPMGWTNSMQVLQGDITYTLQDEIPDVTIPFVDDAGMKGPITRYETADGRIRNDT